MAFSDAFLDEVRSRIRLTEVVGRRVKLVRKGREYMGLCPFHSEKSPSFSVSEEKGFYHCFGCGAHGDAYKFVCETEGLGFREAVERLAEQAGVAVPQESPQEREREEQRKSLYDVVELACNFFEAQLSAAAGAGARAYFAKRGLDDSAQRRFRLGFAPESRSALQTHLAVKGITPQQMKEAGLTAQSESSDTPIDMFRNRAIFPISDPRGRVVAFGARTLLPDVKPKYINSPDTPLFHKGRMLYNLDRARRPAHEKQAAIVAEGYMDVIALALAGFEHAVAPLGTALTEDQLRTLWRMAPEPTLCFDGDAAGQRAAWRALDRALPLLQPGMSLRFAFLPQGQDPDDLIKAHGAAAMGRTIDEALPLIEVLWRRETETVDLTTPERRAALEKKIEEAVRSIAEDTVRDHYRRDLKDRLYKLFNPRAAQSGTRTAQRAWQPGPLRQNGRKQPFGSLSSQTFGNPASLKNSELARRSMGPDAAATAGNPFGPSREALIVLTLLNHPWLVERRYEEIEALTLETPVLDKIRREILNLAASGETLDTQGVRDHLATQGLGDRQQALTERPSLAVHRFARAEAEPADVERGWTTTLALHRQISQLREQVRAARNAWSREQTDESKAHMRNLEEMLASAEAATNELPDTGSYL